MIDMAKDKDSNIRCSQPDFRWQNVEQMPYKEEGSAPFKAISRQILFADSALRCELRYIA
ncbi:MAG: Cupin 2 conserved barrel domain protein [Gammaproteobacteria bacterium]|nr:Cupin 2 conserved barrel domain protein [Gammaproteobacteria bacterium]